MNEIDRFAVLVESFRASLGTHADALLSLSGQARTFMGNTSTVGDLDEMRKHYSKLFDVLQAQKFGADPQLSDADLRFVLQLADALRADINTEMARLAG